jgi:hypothetical protein
MQVLHPAPDEESDEGKIREDAFTSLFRLSFPEEAFSFSKRIYNYSAKSRENIRPPRSDTIIGYRNSPPY